MGVVANLEEYNNVFEMIIGDLTGDEKLEKEMPEVMTRLEKFLRYNIPHHPEIRGYIVATTYAALLGDSLTKEKLHLAYVLEWCWQMINGFTAQVNDFLDNDKSRFGKPSWFRLVGNGRIWVNDAILLEHSVYRLIFKYFGKLAIHSKILEYFVNFLHEVALAQNCEFLHAAQNSKQLDSTWGNIEDYRRLILCLNKKACGLGNVELAYILAESPKPNDVWKKIENIFVQMAYFYTLRNDLNDSYGKHLRNSDPDNDIKTGKWKWLLIKANELCTQEQWNVLMGSYGREDPVAVSIVKGIYNELCLPESCDKDLHALEANLEAQLRELITVEPNVGEIIMEMLKWYRTSLE